MEVVGFTDPPNLKHSLPGEGSTGYFCARRFEDHFGHPPLFFAMNPRHFLIPAGFICLIISTSGCNPTPRGSPGFQSRLFERVEIIGRRGTGLGEFNKPRSLAVDRQDNLYVVDMTGRVQKFSPDGQYLTMWQMPQTDKGKPKGMCCDGEGLIVVLEPQYSRVNHFTADGRLVRQWGGHGTNDGQLAFPRAVAADAQGNIYVSEYGLTERVQAFAQSNATWLRTIGSKGPGNGQCNRPEGLAFDAQGKLYVADSCNHRIQVFSANGQWLASYGNPGQGTNELSYPYDLRVDGSGLQFVCEFGNSRIHVFDRQHRALEVIGRPGSAAGEFSNPWSIALDSHGNLYVADSQNHRVQKLIRRQMQVTQSSRP
jgi:DNA-binding beta-propeller fold protein YncE